MKEVGVVIKTALAWLILFWLYHYTSNLITMKYGYSDWYGDGEWYRVCDKYWWGTPLMITHFLIYVGIAIISLSVFLQQYYRGTNETKNIKS